MNTLPTQFDWTLLRSFLCVIDEGSLQAAARKLGSSQPTLGRHISTLEQQLGQALFERTGRALIPTQLALAIAEHARTMEGGANQISHLLAAHEQHATGTVRISASQSAACHLLPPILAQLRQQQPGITIELVANNRIDNLLRRDADIAVRMVRPEQESLITRHLRDFAVGAYAHRDYLRRRGEPSNAQALLAHDLLGFDHDDSIIRGFARLGLPISKDAFCLRCDDQMALWHALRAGLGIGFIPAYACRNEPDLVQLLPDLPVPPLPVWLTVHREIRGNPKIRLVYDFLAQAILEMSTD